jgi:hypothetical protein
MRAGSFVAASLFGAFCVASPAAAGPPFLTDDPEPVDLGHWEVIGFSMGTVVRGDSAGTLPGVEVNYGALPGLQLHVKVPVSFNSQSVTGTESGDGDTEFGAKYRFINPGEDDWWPQVAVYPAVDLRTGNVPRGLGTGATHMFLPLWMQKDFGKWTSYGGGGYWINPGPGNRNYWFFGWQLQRQVADNRVLGAELFHQTASTSGVPGSVGFPLGSKATTGFDVGGAYDFSANYHLLFSAGCGIQNATTTNQFSYYIGLQWTFQVDPPLCSNLDGRIHGSANSDHATIQRWETLYCEIG